ncbi:hypothetical protein NQZ68_007620 [Dissostichus eleginoides]|nr:hypothetical protein NQZ68_007620 [Dissostichus eleginoides]
MEGVSALRWTEVSLSLPAGPRSRCRLISEIFEKRLLATSTQDDEDDEISHDVEPAVGRIPPRREM